MKRDGRLETFDGEKIGRAILKAFQATGLSNGEIAGELSLEVVRELDKKFEENIFPNVEDVQDIVENILIQRGYSEVAKRYILYRQKRSEIRQAKRLLGVTDDLKLTVNAVKVLRRRYLLKDETGAIKETPKQLLQRVASAIAKGDLLYGSQRSAEKAFDRFFQLMMHLDFLPNSPTLMNANTEIGQLSACFVIPVEDSMGGIFDAAKQMALIHKSGGGTGFSFSRLRPKGDIVGSTMGIASGPVSFMQIFDVSTDVIKQGGRRRGANMGILRVDHPDILEFIAAKDREDYLSNFNISVSATDEFMDTLHRDGEYPLVNPRTGAVVKKLRAKEVFDFIAFMAWKTGDPGIIFIDEINRHNPTPQLGEIESTNPCGEQPLLPYESCILGSINLYNMIKKGEMDWEKLRDTAHESVHFLDNIIGINRYTLPQIEAQSKGNRKIGLGVMGFAEALISLGIPYDSQEALEYAGKVMSFIQREGHVKSSELAEERGCFPNFEGSLWQKRGGKPFRNATVTTVAPTGTISIIAGVTSGIEPLFAVSYVREVMEGTKLIETATLFEQITHARGFYSQDLMMRIAKTGSVQSFKEVPEDIRRLFVTALDIAPEWHVRMQAAFQRHVDNAVAKTVNLPPEATVDEVRRIFQLAYELKCKGITVYRYGSKRQQVLRIESPQIPTLDETHVRVDSEFAGGCPGTDCLY